MSTYVFIACKLVIVATHILLHTKVINSVLLSIGNRKGKGKSINLSLCFVSNALK